LLSFGKKIAFLCTHFGDRQTDNRWTNPTRKAAFVIASGGLIIQVVAYVANTSCNEQTRCAVFCPRPNWRSKDAVFLTARWFLLVDQRWEQTADRWWKVYC